MKTFIVIFCAFFSRASLAETYSRFTPALQISSNQYPLIQMQSAIHYLDSSSGRCTSTTISNQGHQLTARHCLQQCLIRSGVFKLVSEQGLITYFETQKSMLGSAQCEVMIDQKKSTITIQATSPGFIAQFDEAGFATINPTKFRDLEQRGYTSEGDFVIFKTDTQNESCLPLAKNDDLEGPLQSLGYPSETFRGDGYDSNGIDLYFSEGTALPSITDNSCVQNAQPSSSAINRLIADFDQPTSFMSNLDAFYGSSGSAVVNTQLEIVGVMMQMYRHTDITKNPQDAPEVRYCRGSTKALRVSTIFKQIDDSLKTQLNCSMSL